MGDSRPPFSRAPQPDSRGPGSNLKAPPDPRWDGLQSVLEALPIGAAVLDRDHRLVYSNPKFVKLRGVPYETAGWLDAIHPDDRHRVLESRTRAFEQAVPWADTYRFIRSDAAIVWVSARAVPLRSGSGVMGFVLTLEDISALKNTEAKLHQANQELRNHASELETEVLKRTAKAQEALYELERLGYTIVHDMRAPLRTLRGYSQVLLREYSGRLDGKAKEYLSRIAEAARRQDRLIQDLLVYHSYVRDDFPLAPLDLDKLVNHVLQSYPEYQPPKALVELRPLGWAMAHETLLTQCCSALLSNAVKFVPEGATPRITIWTEHTSSHVDLCIEDRGIGIAPEYHAKIFDVFETLHSRGTFPGTGIGLALTRKAMEKMQGSIRVQSEAGHGARFSLQLTPVPGARSKP